MCFMLIYNYYFFIILFFLYFVDIIILYFYICILINVKISIFEFNRCRRFLLMGEIFEKCKLNILLN